MVRYFYRLNRKRMYLDKTVYDSINKFNIQWSDIESEANRLKATGHPKPTYNTAAMFLIDKKGGSDVFGFSSSKSSLFGRASNKKGFVVDNITLFITLMIMIAMIVTFAAFIENQNSSVQSSPGFDSIYKSTFNTSTSGFDGAADVGMVVGLIILVSFLLYSAYTIGSNFSLFLLALLVNMVALYLLPIFEDWLVTAYYNNSYAAAISAMPATFFVINHYTIFLTGLSVLLLIALFVKPSPEASY